MSERKPSVDPPLLVTGASGFVGRAVVEAAARRAWPVRAAVRRLVEAQGNSQGNAVLSSGFPGLQGGKHGADSSCGSSPSGVSVWEVGDISRDVNWAPALEGVESIVHLAGLAQVPAGSANAALDTLRRIHVDGSDRLASAARREGVKRLVYVSTAKVLGESSPRDRPFDDDSAPDPQDAYSRTKLEAEDALMAHHVTGAFEVVILRPPIVYGQGASGHLRRLAEWIAAGRPLPLASIRNLRSLVGVGNLADALLAAALHPRAAGHRYLVSEGTDLSTAEICRAVAAAIGRPALLWPCPERLLVALTAAVSPGLSQRLTRSLRIDGRRFQRDLGWTPTLTLEQGMDGMRSPEGDIRRL